LTIFTYLCSTIVYLFKRFEIVIDLLFLLYFFTVSVLIRQMFISMMVLRWRQLGRKVFERVSRVFTVSVLIPLTKVYLYDGPSVETVGQESRLREPHGFLQCVYWSHWRRFISTMILPWRHLGKKVVWESLTRWDIVLK
jgi:hypothetical protein